MNIFCTLFDSNYLDKGVVLYQSLKEAESDFKLYILAMDEACFSILSKMALPQMVLIDIKSFETDDLKRIRKERSRQEYCWTCGCFTVKYVLEHYGEPVCTYIDADMFFYDSTQSLFDEFNKSGKSVGIMPHRFPDCQEGREQEQLSGKYCVEFNTFKNDKSGKEVLEWWCSKCLEECRGQGTGGWFGDQKYLDRWEELFDSIYVYRHWGAGVAPWNVSQYRIVKKRDGKKTDILLRTKKTEESFPLIFYHFHQIVYLDNNLASTGINLRPGKTDRRWEEIYRGYLRQLDEARKELKKKGDIDLYAGTKYEQLPDKLRQAGSYLKSDYAIPRKCSMIWRILVRRNRDIINY